MMTAIWELPDQQRFTMPDDRIGLAIAIPEAQYKKSGLFHVDWALSPVTCGSDITLQVYVGIHPNTVYSVTVSDHSGWFGVHSHLLENGAHTLVVSALRNGELLCQAMADFHVLNEGQIAAKVRNSLQATGVPIVFNGPCDTSAYDYANQELVPWFDKPNALEIIEAWTAQQHITGDEAEALRHYVEAGYIVLPGCVDESLLMRVDAAIDDAVANKVQGYEIGSSQRIERLHEIYPAIRELWLYPAVMRMLRLVFQEQVLPCQTLTYVFGSQQDAHQDTIHLTPFPAGYMCGVWVALEDVRPDSGELEVYSGSHRLPRVYMQNSDCQKVKGDWQEFGKKVVARWAEMRRGHERVIYRPKRGDVLIWHENLMHAGSVRRNLSLSRRSMVSHCFADGALVFYDSTGLIGYTEPRERLHV